MQHFPHDPVFFRDDQWYFWDETWSDWLGPYESEKIAREEMEDYVCRLEQATWEKQHTMPRILVYGLLQHWERILDEEGPDALMAILLELFAVGALLGVLTALLYTYMIGGGGVSS